MGVTRAREHLLISYARARHPGGRASRRHSRFLDGIWPTEADADGAGARRRGSGDSSPRARAKEAAALFEQENDPATIALFEALRAWRAEEAKGRSVPAYTVFADTTLRSIAVVKPGTRQQLALIRGVGPVKIEAYSEAVLAIVREQTG